MPERPRTDDAERGYTITRTFDAPRQLVWNAWTDPEQFAQWFGGPAAVMESVTMDVRPQGAWRGTMVVNDMRIPWSGRYREVVEPERLVFAFVDAEEIGDVFELMTITFADLGDKTEMVLRQSGGHLTDEEYGRAKEGTAGFLDAMEELLARSR